MDYKNRVRVDLKQKGAKLLVRDRWDGKDDPWARRHFFDVSYTAPVLAMVLVLTQFRSLSGEREHT